MTSATQHQTPEGLGHLTKRHVPLINVVHVNLFHSLSFLISYNVSLLCPQTGDFILLFKICMIYLYKYKYIS